MMDEYSRLQRLYEIADGAMGDGPWMAGLAREEIKRMGYSYPADPSEMQDPAVLNNET